MATEPANRAGAYVRQTTDYRAFIPNALPPQPPIAIDDEMWNLLSKADRALGRLDGSTETLPNPDLFVYMYVRKEALLSSQIEGTQSTLVDVLEFEASHRDPSRAQDSKEVINYIGAMHHGLERLKDFPMSLRLIREIHGCLLAGVRGGNLHPGEFRTSQNWIGGSSPATARYVPPPPHEMTAALGNLETFIHDEQPMPALIKIGMVHSQFETIHPFLDGNGRIGRLLITFLLCSQSIMKRPLLYLSYYFKKNRTEYYDRLQAVRDKGDWEGWLKFFLRGVYDVSQEATTKARFIATLREQHRQEITNQLGSRAGNALIVLESLYSQPWLNIQRIVDMTGLTFPNANTLARKLCDIGILGEITGQKRNRLFMYTDYVNLFKDDEVTDTPTIQPPA